MWRPVGVQSTGAFDGCRIIGAASYEDAEHGREGGVLENTCNQVVSFVHATSADEFGQLLARLPDVVKAGLADELAKFSDAHRYDGPAQRAYYFERQGTGVIVWSWNHVFRPHEAGELIFRVVSSPGTLDEKLANECYARATGRAVTNPRPQPTDEPEG